MQLFAGALHGTAQHSGHESSLIGASSDIDVINVFSQEGARAGRRTAIETAFCASRSGPPHHGCCTAQVVPFTLQDGSVYLFGLPAGLVGSEICLPENNGTFSEPGNCCRTMQLCISHDM